MLSEVILEPYRQILLLNTTSSFFLEALLNYRVNFISFSQLIQQFLTDKLASWVAIWLVFQVVGTLVQCQFVLFQHIARISDSRIVILDALRLSFCLLCFVLPRE